MKRSIFAGIALVFAYSACFGLTLSDIRSEVRRNVKDTTDTTNYTRWTDAVLTARINMVQKEVASYTRCCYNQYVTTPTAGTQEYAKPSDIITIDRVSYISYSSATANGQYKKVGWASMGMLDRDLVSWEYSADGLPRYYYERGEYIGLYPAPSTTYVSTGCLKIDYYCHPTDLSSDSDVPFNSDTDLYAYHSTIIPGVVAMCLKDMGDYAGAQASRAEYVDMMKFMKENILDRPDRQSTLKVQ